MTGEFGENFRWEGYDVGADEGNLFDVVGGADGGAEDLGSEIPPGMYAMVRKSPTHAAIPKILNAQLVEVRELGVPGWPGPRR